MKTKKVWVRQLQKGMFVQGLDRPIYNTPFPAEGFYIFSDADIEKLKAYCRYVMVNTGRSKIKAYGNKVKKGVQEASAQICRDYKKPDQKKTQAKENSPLCHLLRGVGIISVACIAVTLTL